LTFVHAPKTGSFGQQAVAIDLRGRSQDRVVEAMADMAVAATGQEHSRADRDLDVDRMNSVAEGRNQSIEPLVQRVSSFRMPGASSFDGGFDLDERGH